MLLPDHEIRAAVAAGRVGITPWDPSLVQPASLDIRLGEEFYIRTPEERREIVVPARPYVMKFVQRAEEIRHTGPLDLMPGQFVLAHTLETVTLPADIAGRVEGKSSLGRLGLLTHSTAGFIDPGFSGMITLELSNLSQENIPLVPGEPVGQLCFMRMASPAERPYGSPGLGSHYQGQRGATPSRFTTTPPAQEAPA